MQKGSPAKSIAECNGRFIGRKFELQSVLDALKLGEHVLIEGPVGVGKTTLALEAARALKRALIRVDGDGRYTEQKLAGYFDPAKALKGGYSLKTWTPGPLVQAMKSGSLLLINELNRMPEGVQNVLLPALDEGKVQIPELGEVKAKSGFAVIATQNPADYIGTGELSEAIEDRFEYVRLNYAPEAEELAILSQYSSKQAATAHDLVLRTRTERRLRRGASLRAGIALTRALESGSDLEAAALRSLTTRVEVDRALSDASVNEVLRDLVRELREGRPRSAEKKSP